MIRIHLINPPRPFYKVLGIFYPTTQAKHTLNTLKSDENIDLKMTISYVKNSTIFYV